MSQPGIVRREVLAQVDEDDLIAQWLCNLHNLEDAATIREYAALAQSRFSGLPGNAQRQVLAWIEAGPGPMNLAGPQLDDESLRRWRLQRLHPIRGQLPDPWLARYETYASQGPWPDVQAIPQFTVQTTKPVSPVESAKLQSMEIDQIVRLCHSYAMDSEWSLDTPSARGLASALREAVIADPSRFAEGATQFRHLAPRYISAIINGLRASILDPSPPQLRWEPLFELVAYSATYGASTVEDSLQEDDGEGWLDTRRAAAQFMMTVFGAPYETNEDLLSDISAHAWRQVLVALCALSSDPDPDDALVSMLQQQPASYGILRDHQA